MSTSVELSDGVRVAVSRCGDGPRHVLFVHGFRNAGSAWAAAIERLPDGVMAVVPELVGHSLGGGIGIRVALDHPDLLGGLVLIAPISTRGFDFLTSRPSGSPTPRTRR